MTEKYFGFKFEKAEVLPLFAKGYIGCNYNINSGNKNMKITITDNNNSVLANKEPVGTQEGIKIFNNYLEVSKNQKQKSNTNRTLRVIESSDNSILLTKSTIVGNNKNLSADFIIKNYVVGITYSEGKNELDEDKFENFVKEFYESVKF